MKFTELGLSDITLEGIRNVGFTDCTAVQEMVLPVSLTGRDVMVQSKTGSGKTAIFLLTIIEKYVKALNAGLPAPVALIIAPTRELAVQIENDAIDLAKNIPLFRVGCFYGGVGYATQNKEIESGLALYVGTPGRLIDFASSNKIDFRMFSTVVLDEADRMFDMGFYPDIQRMFSMMVKPKERQTMLLSATLSTKVRNLAWEYMNNPEEIESQPEEITVKNITQELFHVSKEEKFPLLLQLVSKINPGSCLVFTNTKDKAVEVSKRLSANGYSSAYLMGDMAQSDRLKTLDKMKDGKIKFLVATDVAARGLQIDDLELVVNYDIPEDFESYVHRIGRTARAGKSGKAITLACEEYIYGLEAIENYIQMKIPVLWADECELPEVEDKSKDMVFRHPSRRPVDKKGVRSSDRRSRGASERKPAGKKPVRKAMDDNKVEKLPKSDEKELKKLSAMSLEDRMKYYKKTYGGQSETKKSSAASKKSSAQKGKEQRSAKPSVNAGPKMSSVPTQKSVQPKKKESLWSKVKSLFKSSK